MKNQFIWMMDDGNSVEYCVQMATPHMTIATNMNGVLMTHDSDEIAQYVFDFIFL